MGFRAPHIVDQEDDPEDDPDLIDPEDDPDPDEDLDDDPELIDETGSER